jgi:hypothetical protein
MRQEVSARHEALRGEIREVGDLLSLFSSLGWKTLEGRLRERERQLVAELLEAGGDQVGRLQGRTSEVRDILAWPQRFERRMERLEGELQRVEARL